MSITILWRPVERGIAIDHGGSSLWAALTEQQDSPVILDALDLPWLGELAGRFPGAAELAEAVAAHGTIAVVGEP